jgi:hypothetical protein
MDICCPVNLNDSPHCDKLKGRNSISFNLHTQTLQQSIEYASKDGLIRSTNTTWNKEMNELLNLNHTMLKANRKEALWGVIGYLNTANWTTQTVNNKLNQWRQLNAEGKYFEFCGIIIWYLQKKLKTTNQQSSTNQ